MRFANQCYLYFYVFAKFFFLFVPLLSNCVMSKFSETTSRDTDNRQQMSLVNLMFLYSVLLSSPLSVF